MDADRFETLFRSLSTSPSRRTALRLLAGSSLGGILTLGALPTDAKKKKKKKKKKKGIPPTTTVPPTNDGTGTPPPCTGSCEGKICGDDGCGASCGTCDGDATCTAEGQCSCGAGRFYGCDIDFTDACGCCGMEEYFTCGFGGGGCGCCALGSHPSGQVCCPVGQESNFFNECE